VAAAFCLCSVTWCLGSAPWYVLVLATQSFVAGSNMLALGGRGLAFHMTLSAVGLFPVTAKDTLRLAGLSPAGLEDESHACRRLSLIKQNAVELRFLVITALVASAIAAGIFWVSRRRVGLNSCCGLCVRRTRVEVWRTTSEEEKTPTTQVSSSSSSTRGSAPDSIGAATPSESMSECFSLQVTGIDESECCLEDIPSYEPSHLTRNQSDGCTATHSAGALSHAPAQLSPMALSQAAASGEVEEQAAGGACECPSAELSGAEQAAGAPGPEVVVEIAGGWRSEGEDDGPGTGGALSDAPGMLPKDAEFSD